MPENQTLGEKVVELYEKATLAAKRPGGSCFGVVHRRVQAAARAHCENRSLPSLKLFQQFDRLWGSKLDPKKSWLKYPPELRARGPAGALTMLGWGTLVEQAEIWRPGPEPGGLLPGAVIQVWRTEEEFARVRDGLGSGFGHAFIFRRYVNLQAAPQGMLVADQGFLTRDNLDRVVMPETFARWFGVNINCPA
jgi:hypothetical protein